MTSNREIAIFSFTLEDGKNKAMKLIGERGEKVLSRSISSDMTSTIETVSSTYTVYKYGHQMNGIRFNEAHVNDLFTVRYALHISQGLQPLRDMNSTVHYFSGDGEEGV